MTGAPAAGARRLLDPLDDTVLRLVADTTSDGLVVLDGDGVVTLVNPAAESMLGSGRADLLGAVLHERVHRTRPDGRPFSGDDCPITATAAAGEGVVVDRDAFYRHDGTSFPVEYTASGFTVDGRPGAVVVFRDGSRRIQEELRLRDELQRLTWVGRAQDALEEDRLLLYAQPIVRLSDGQVVQHELLLRLQFHDEVVLPGVFLPVAEEFGLISRIDRWVVGKAAELVASGHPVEINLSARSVADPEMVDVVRTAIGEHHASAGLLVCEITETAVMGNESLASRFVDAVAALGCGVALDDFGAGYGGFSYLKRLKVTHLKIDKQFVLDAVREESSRHVLAAIVSLAKAFGVETVAEGVETPEVLALLHGLGVDLAQGFFLGRPQPLDVAFAGGGAHS